MGAFFIKKINNILDNINILYYTIINNKKELENKNLQSTAPTKKKVVIRLLTSELIKKIKTVLKSDLSSYRIAKDIGYRTSNQIHRYRNGDSDILDMKLSTAAMFEKIYDERFNKED